MAGGVLLPLCTHAPKHTYTCTYIDGYTHIHKNNKDLILKETKAMLFDCSRVTQKLLRGSQCIMNISAYTIAPAIGIFPQL